MVLELDKKKQDYNDNSRRKLKWFFSLLPPRIWTLDLPKGQLHVHMYSSCAVHIYAPLLLSLGQAGGMLIWIHTTGPSSLISMLTGENVSRRDRRRPPSGSISQIPNRRQPGIHHLCSVHGRPPELHAYTSRIDNVFLPVLPHHTRVKIFHSYERFW